MSVPGRVQLCKAIWMGDLEGVKKWLSPYNLEAANWRGWTALVFACQSGHPAIVEYMIRAGANVGVKDKLGRTLLHHARKSVELVELLLDSGLDVNEKDRLGNTPLHTCDPDETDVVRRLLEAGADVYATNYSGLSPFGKFCRHDIASLLCEYQAYSYLDVPCKRSKCWLCQKPVFMCNAKRSLYLDLYRQFSMKTHKANPLRTFSTYDVRSVVFPIIHPNDERFNEECEVELERMKNERVGDSGVKYSSVWSGSMSALRNPHVQQAMTPEQCLRKFPIYGEALRKRFVDGTKRLDLLDRAVQAFSVYVPTMLPECVEQILSYLATEDLRTLIVTCGRA